MVDAGHGADDCAVIVADGDTVVDRVAVKMVVPDDVDGGRHHPAAHIHAVHRLCVICALQCPYRESGLRQVRLVIGEPQPVGVARVDEQFGGRQGDQHLRFAGVHADVASTPPLVAQHLRELVRIGEGLAENQSTPTEFDDYIVGHGVDHVRR